MTSLSPWVPCVPCFLCVPSDFCLTCVPSVPLSPLCCLCPLSSLCPLLSVVSLMSPVFLFSSRPLCLLMFCVFCVPLFRLQNMTYSVALPLFLIWRENFDGFHCFHITTCGVFLHAQDVKGCDFFENKKRNTKFYLTRLNFFYLINQQTVHWFIYLHHYKHGNCSFPHRNI